MPSDSARVPAPKPAPVGPIVNGRRIPPPPRRVAPHTSTPVAVRTQTPPNPPSRASTATLITRLRIEIWPDPVMEKLGHDPCSGYVEAFWLGVLGPSTTWLLRRLTQRLTDAPEGFDLDCVALSHELGLGGHVGRNSVFMRSVDRCCKFGMAQRSGETVFVRRRIPSLTRRQIERLPPRLLRLHDEWDSTTDSSATEARPSGEVAKVQKARQLALTLLELGEESDDAERQLHAWHFHPAVAWQAVQWAAQQRQADTEAPG